MGTLTADCPRLDSHCPHKLATSCRLTSTMNCCACADERVHSRTYRVYIDGVGFVQRGTRWQGYCWFCKEFWSNRLAATDPPIEVADTRIPEIPDQTEFLDRWWEFHQRYRVVKRPDGSEQRIAVIGEPFHEVSPGFLPRTLDQLRAGVRNNARRPENRLRRARLASEEEPSGEPHQSLDDALNDLMNEVSDDDAILQELTPGQAAPQLPAVSPATAHPPEAAALHRVAELESRAEELGGMAEQISRGEARLRRARERFARVFGSREDVQQDDYESPLTTMYSRAYDRYRQAEQRRAEGTTAPPLQLEGLSPEERREVDEELLWGVIRDSDILADSLLEQEGDVWAYDPTNPPTLPPPTYTANDDENDDDDEEEEDEETSDENPAPDTTQTTDWAEAAAAEAAEALSRRARVQEIINRQRLMRVSLEHPGGPSYVSALPSSNDWPGLNQLLQRLEATNDMASQWRQMHTTSHLFGPPPPRHQPPPSHTLDNQPDRPEPKTDEEMTRVLACQVCYQQLANIAVLPCGHMCMCEWCADVVVPVKHEHIPAVPTNCPMCRRKVKQRFKIHVG
ncbi:hypothetical protein IQ07DRAFT_633324 [Pyrenochaeta sp. DS3sAY3a]|nr:hypothetical protein IQ07DRAFT_633324 [Pyrenochaeta sp. DS3sAY3a]